jgi:hypothetical protein
MAEALILAFSRKEKESRLSSSPFGRRIKDEGTGVGIGRGLALR